MRSVLTIIFLLAFAIPCSAAKLPKDATPMATDQITNLYADHTISTKVSDIFFSKDGKTMGVFGKPKIKSVFSGTWEVKGNEFCMHNSPQGETKVYTDCNKFWMSGKKMYNLWSAHYDGSNPDTVGGYDPAPLKLRSGNTVADKYSANGGK